MIQIVQYPTVKSPIVAYVYIMFGHDEWQMDYQKRHDYVDALAYLRSSKHSILASNIETFRRYCEELFFPADGRIQIAEDAINTLHEHTVWVLGNKEKWNDCLEKTLEKATFMRLLIKNAKPDDKPFLIIMDGLIVDFCKKELDECKKDQGENKNGSGAG